MKWRNKGHEFDAEGARLKRHKIIYIYGAGDYGKKMFQLLKRLGIQVVFIDSNRLKQESGYLGCQVISPEQLSKEEKKLIILCAIPQYVKEMSDKLEQLGYQKNFDYYEMKQFCTDILPVYSLYCMKMIYMDSISFLSTTVCNLNCEACLNLTPYNRHPKHRVVTELKDTIDHYFAHINYVNLFSYSGGEPLLYPDIDEILEYIGYHYIEKIGTFAISTNCTKIPRDRTCEIIQKYNMKIYIDDYSEYVLQSREVLPKLVEKLEKYQIDYSINDGKKSYWIDLAPYQTDNTAMNEFELEQYRRRCAVPYRELREGRIYSCNYASFAMKAGIQEDSDNDWYDLIHHEKLDNRILLEFLMGFTNQGYVDFCKHCAGFLTINPYKKPIGKQLPR